MAATTIATMAMIKTTTRSITPQLSSSTTKQITTKSPISLTLKSQTPLTSAAIAGAIFTTLSSCDAAFAVQQIADIAEGDNRGTLLLFVIAPAIGWVLFNILQPAINQFNKMRSNKGLVIGLGLSGLAASGLVMVPEASAAAEAAGSDNRGTLLLFVIAPAIGWVLFNILQPALNQINKMRS